MSHPKRPKVARQRDPRDASGLLPTPEKPAQAPAGKNGGKRRGGAPRAATMSAAVMNSVSASVAKAAGDADAAHERINDLDEQFAADELSGALPPPPADPPREFAFEDCHFTDRFEFLQRWTRSCPPIEVRRVAKYDDHVTFATIVGSGKATEHPVAHSLRHAAEALFVYAGDGSSVEIGGCSPRVTALASRMKRVPHLHTLQPLFAPTAFHDRKVARIGSACGHLLSECECFDLSEIVFTCSTDVIMYIFACEAEVKRFAEVCADLPHFASCPVNAPLRGTLYGGEVFFDTVIVDGVLHQTSLAKGDHVPYTNQRVSLRSDVDFVTAFGYTFRVSRVMDLAKNGTYPVLCFEFAGYYQSSPHRSLFGYEPTRTVEDSRLEFYAGQNGAPAETVLRVVSDHEIAVSAAIFGVAGVIYAGEVLNGIHRLTGGIGLSELLTRCGRTLWTQPDGKAVLCCDALVEEMARRPRPRSTTCAALHSSYRSLTNVHRSTCVTYTPQELSVMSTLAVKSAYRDEWSAVTTLAKAMVASVALWEVSVGPTPTGVRMLACGAIAYTAAAGGWLDRSPPQPVRLVPFMDAAYPHDIAATCLAPIQVNDVALDESYVASLRGSHPFCRSKIALKAIGLAIAGYPPSAFCQCPGTTAVGIQRRLLVAQREHANKANLIQAINNLLVRVHLTAVEFFLLVTDDELFADFIKSRPTTAAAARARQSLSDVVAGRHRRHPDVFTKIETGTKVDAKPRPVAPDEEQATAVYGAFTRPYISIVKCALQGGGILILCGHTLYVPDCSNTLVPGLTVCCSTGHSLDVRSKYEWMENTLEADIVMCDASNSAGVFSAVAALDCASDNRIDEYLSDWRKHCVARFRVRGDGFELNVARDSNKSGVAHTTGANVISNAGLQQVVHVDQHHLTVNDYATPDVEFNPDTFTADYRAVKDNLLADIKLFETGVAPLSVLEYSSSSLSAERRPAVRAIARIDGDDSTYTTDARIDADVCKASMARKGFVGEVVAHHNRDKVSFCSCWIAPMIVDGEPGYAMVPKVLRTLIKRGYTTKVLARGAAASYLAQIEQNVRGVWNEMPLLSDWCALVRRSTNGAKQIRSGIVDDQVRAGYYRATPETMEWFCRVYDTTPDEVAEVSTIIRGVDRLPACIEHPLFDRMASVEGVPPYRTTLRHDTFMSDEPAETWYSERWSVDRRSVLTKLGARLFESSPAMLKPGWFANTDYAMDNFGWLAAGFAPIYEEVLRHNYGIYMMAAEVAGNVAQGVSPFGGVLMGILVPCLGLSVRHAILLHSAWNISVVACRRSWHVVFGLIPIALLCATPAHALCGYEAWLGDLAACRSSWLDSAAGVAWRVGAGVGVVAGLCASACASALAGFGAGLAGETTRVTQEVVVPAGRIAADAVRERSAGAAAVVVEAACVVGDELRDRFSHDVAPRAVELLQHVRWRAEDLAECAIDAAVGACGTLSNIAGVASTGSSQGVSILLTLCIVVAGCFLFDIIELIPRLLLSYGTLVPHLSCARSMAPKPKNAPKSGKRRQRARRGGRKPTANVGNSRVNVNVSQPRSRARRPRAAVGPLTEAASSSLAAAIVAPQMATDALRLPDSVSVPTTVYQQHLEATITPDSTTEEIAVLANADPDHALMVRSKNPPVPVPSYTARRVYPSAHAKRVAFLKRAQFDMTHAHLFREVHNTIRGKRDVAGRKLSASYTTPLRGVGTIMSGDDSKRAVLAYDTSSSNSFWRQNGGMNTAFCSTGSTIPLTGVTELGKPHWKFSDEVGEPVATVEYANPAIASGATQYAFFADPTQSIAWNLAFSAVATWIINLYSGPTGVGHPPGTLLATATGTTSVGDNVLILPTYTGYTGSVVAEIGFGSNTNITQGVLFYGTADSSEDWVSMSSPDAAVIHESSTGVRMSAESLVGKSVAAVTARAGQCAIATLPQSFLSEGGVDDLNYDAIAAITNSAQPTAAEGVYGYIPPFGSAQMNFRNEDNLPTDDGDGDNPRTVAILKGLDGPFWVRVDLHLQGTSTSQLFENQAAGSDVLAMSRITNALARVPTNMSYVQKDGFFAALSKAWSAAEAAFPSVDDVIDFGKAVATGLAKYALPIAAGLLL